ncbi:MAG: ankyrin repeat domain-containing protein [Betaproteobacteria bacterium]|nr:MAG: ankyrin repeat domain-containing protein [Betaproteobacteria bacterium]
MRTLCHNWVLIAAALFAPCAAAAFSDADRALFEEAATPGASNAVRERAGSLGRRLGNEQDMAALDYLIGRSQLSLIRNFAEGSVLRNSTPGFEERVLKHFGNRELAEVLIPGLYQYRNPELFEALYRDAETLARWRRERRQKCRAQIAEYRAPIQARGGRGHAAIQAAPAQGAIALPAGRQPRIGFLPGAGLITWNYTCASAGEDDSATDLDGRPFGAGGRPNREWASAEAVARTLVPGVEARLGPLFRDLSLFPAADWSRAGGRPDGIVFQTARPPAAFLQFFRSRHYSPDAAGAIAVLKEMAPNDQGTQTDRDTWWNILALHHALVSSDSLEATQQLATDIERAAAIENPEDRNDFLTRLTPLLGPVLPPAQVDLARLKSRVLERLPYERVAASSGLFTRVEAENRSLREPSAESLTRWIESEHYRRIVPNLLAHGANPNGPVAQSVQPPLLMAAYSNPDAAMLLLDARADVNIRGMDGKTPLHAACDSGYGKPERVELAALLLARGANVNAASSAGQTPLHPAASGSPKCVRLLLAAGAKVEAADNIGSTPLAWAASNNNVETAKLLLDAGADPNREDKEGGSPYAAAYDNKPEVKALLEIRGGRLSVKQIANRARLKLMYPSLFLQR